MCENESSCSFQKYDIVILEYGHDILPKWLFKGPVLCDPMFQSLVSV